MLVNESFLLQATHWKSVDAFKSMSPHANRQTMKICAEVTVTYLLLPCTSCIFMLLDACATLNDSFTFSFAFESLYYYGMI